MTIKGTIISISETQEFGTSGFYKKDLVLETEEQYPQKLLIEFHKEKSDELNHFAEGQVVTVSINLRGKEWNSPQGETKYFNTLVGWRIEADPIP
jgi:hypothetical protein